MQFSVIPRRTPFFVRITVRADHIIDSSHYDTSIQNKFHHHHHHHHHVVPLSRISLTLSRHSSLSLIAFGRSSGLHPLSSHSCCMYVRAGRSTFSWPYVGVHRSTSLMSSSLLLQPCPACLVRLTCIENKFKQPKTTTIYFYQRFIRQKVLKFPVF